MRAQEGSPSWWALALMFLLALGLGYQLWMVARLKAAQHIFVTPLAPIAPQGREPGKVENPLAIKAGPGRTVLALHRVESAPPSFAPRRRLPYYWIQRLDAGLKPEASRTFDKDSLLEGAVDLAVDLSATAHVACRDGRIVRLDRRFEPLGELKLPVGELDALEVSDSGHFFALEARARKVSCFDAQGRLVAETPKNKLRRPKRVALCGSGKVAVLDESKTGYIIKLFSADLKFERSMPVMNVKPSQAVRLAAAGKHILLLNDAQGARGVLFFRADTGSLAGETLGAGQEPMIHPGFVAGDRWNGDLYLHFSPGLLKCRLPEEIYGEALLGGAP